MYVAFLFKLGNYPDILQGTDNQKMELLDHLPLQNCYMRRLKY